jgi:hypothetical protein
MDESGLVPLTSGKFDLIWGVLFSSSRAAYSASFLTSPEIGVESSLSFKRSRPSSSFLTYVHSSSFPPTWVLLSPRASLSHSIILASISSLCNSSIFLSPVSPGLISFRNTSDFFIYFFTFPYHHLSTMASLLRAHSLLMVFSF